MMPTEYDPKVPKPNAHAVITLDDDMMDTFPIAQQEKYIDKKLAPLQVLPHVAYADLPGAGRAGRGGRRAALVQGARFC